MAFVPYPVSYWVSDLLEMAVEKILIFNLLLVWGKVVPIIIHTHTHVQLYKSATHALPCAYTYAAHVHAHALTHTYTLLIFNRKPG